VYRGKEVQDEILVQFIYEWMNNRQDKYVEKIQEANEGVVDLTGKM